MSRQQLAAIITLFFLIISAQPIAFGQQPLRKSRITSGEPTLIGNLGGRVLRNPSQFQELTVMIDFGEISPINRNRLVKISVPITVTCPSPFQITASAAVANDGEVLRSSDIGFGIQNLRPAGTNTALNPTRPIVANQFENDPTMTVSRKKTGRVNYLSSLADIGYATVLLQNQSAKLDHALTNSKPNRARKSLISEEDSWTFDAVFAIAPQFYPPGQFSVAITFTIESTPESLSTKF